MLLNRSFAAAGSVNVFQQALNFQSGSSLQKIQRLPNTSRMAAIVTPWYTRSSVCRELLGPREGVSMAMDAFWELIVIVRPAFQCLAASVTQSKPGMFLLLLT